MQFETGYPYIGLSEKHYDAVADILKRSYDGMECAKGAHWGLCRVANQTCEEVQ